MRIPALLVLLFLNTIVLSAENPASFAYVLQADSLANTKAAAVEKLAASGRDWLVLDADYDNETQWQRKDLDAIRKGKPRRKILAYISIGEAEDYRTYWNKAWLQNGKPTAQTPSWLGKENPDWKGNFRVKYWQVDWQKLMLAVITNAMERGFDGVYLDIVDAFETWEFDGKDWIENRPNPETKKTYRQDMVDWVKAIAVRAREVKQAALVIPQNGSQLLECAEFLQTVSAIGIEDLFSEGDKKQSSSHTKEVVPHLKALADAGKPALVIEYPKNLQKQEISKKLAHENGLVWLVTDRDLKTLGISGK